VGRCRWHRGHTGVPCQVVWWDLGCTRKAYLAVYSGLCSLMKCLQAPGIARLDLAMQTG
jgi:hypothetical protein